ncbi:MAG: hypothetical protein AMXMBFR81_14390 [Chthonomonas sp.]
MRRLLLTFPLILAVASCFAQMPDLSPPKELAKLDFMKGSWSGSGTMTMEGQTMPFSGTMTNATEGQFLKLDSVNDMAGLKMTEMAYVAYDAANSRYTIYTFTNFSPAPRIEHGKFEGEKFVTVSEPWNVMGQKHVSRTTMWKVDADTLGLKLEFQIDDRWVPSLETTFKRKK